MARSLTFQKIDRQQDKLGAIFSTVGAGNRFLPLDVINYMLDPHELDAEKEIFVTAFEANYNVPVPELKKAFGKICEASAHQIYESAERKQRCHLEFMGLSEEGTYALFLGPKTRIPKALDIDLVKKLLKEAAYLLPDGSFIPNRELVKALDGFSKGARHLKDEDIFEELVNTRPVFQALCYSGSSMRDGVAWAEFSQTGVDMKPFGEVVCSAPEKAVTDRLKYGESKGFDAQTWKGDRDECKSWMDQAITEFELMKAARACAASREACVYALAAPAPVAGLIAYQPSQA